MIENKYFTFDWRKAAFHQYARSNRENFTRCNKCGILFERYYEDENCCDAEDREFIQPTIAQLEECLSEVYYEDIPADMSEQMLFDALKNEGFKVYRKALAPLTDPIGREIKDAIRQIKEAKTPEERLTSALWASHIQHVYGNIMEDWGEKIGFDWRQFESIQQGGLASVFGESEINEFFGITGEEVVQ